MTDRGNARPDGFEPLDPAQFSFYGFGDSLRAMERRVRRVGLRGGEPSMAVVEDALFVPSESLRVTGQPSAHGFLSTADGQPVAEARQRRKGREPAGGAIAPGAVEPAREVEAEVVYLGPLFHHFGLVLLESLARIWSLTEIDPTIPVVFDYPNTVRRSREPWVRQVLGAFGIPASRILELAVPTRLRRVLVPEPLFEQMHTAHEAMIRPYREVAARIAGDVAPSGQPLYLSRRLLTSRQRPIVGEDELEDVLRENGFVVAYPETMAFADQIRLINGHRDIFAGIGSAAHGVLFARHRPTLHLLTTRDHVSANYFLCSALADVPTTFVGCLGTGDRPSFSAERPAGQVRTRGGERDGGAGVGTGPQATPHLVEMPTLAGYLEQRGFLATRLRASLAGRDPRLRERYDEAWLYGRVRKAATRPGLTLPPELEAEALRLAARSWPVSAILARYYAWARRDAARADGLARQFAALAGGEADMNRLVHYLAEVESMAARVIPICAPDTARLLTAVMAERFGSDALGEEAAAGDDH